MYNNIEYENLEFNEEYVDLWCLSYMISLHMSGSIIHCFYSPVHTLWNIVIYGPNHVLRNILLF